MDVFSEYERLPDRDKDAFARLVSLLLERTFLLRDVWDGREQRLVASPEFRFAERHLPLLTAYLRIGGFELQVDGRRGVMALYNRYGRNRARVDKLTTYLLYVLRLVYDEQLERASLRREVIVPLGEVFSRLHVLGLADRRLAATALRESLERLRRWSVLERVDGEGEDPESRWILYPTIRLLVTDEQVSALYERLARGSLAGDAAEEAAEEAAT
jgi:hypothetical protein